ncbi:MAG TPA: DUF1835 domain-containing protein [Pyrinomonadaceae bacterium]|nr:DUF1835 domain-containing protein [Pyrinomonadaceae bacterium]
MKIHVLPGDSVAEAFAAAGLDGETVVCRECLVDGDISGETLEEFWDLRANFIEVHYSGDPLEYRERVAYELERLLDAGPEDEVFLWFEYELFCQANMWFCLTLLKTTQAKVFRVMPAGLEPDKIWDGFGAMTADDLAGCFDERVEFTAADIDAACDLWKAFRDRDSGRLLELGEYRSSAFPFLKEVCRAAAEIETRPQDIVNELLANGHTALEDVFPEFRKRAGVYGFGDLQVERLIHAASH